jgi:hypothetical protein
MKKNCAILTLSLPALLAALALLLAGCKDFSFYGVLGDRIDDTPLQIAPTSATVAQAGGMVTFTASGGKPPYTYSVASGAASGSVTTTGTFTGAGPGVAIVRVTDTKSRTSDAAVTVNDLGMGVSISPVIVCMGPGGSLTFVASGGMPPYAFSLTASGSGSPTIGAVTGAYVAGASIGADTIRVQDSIGDSDAATVDVTAAMVTVDYGLEEASFVIPSPVTGGSAIPAGYSFRVRNASSADGGQTIYWWVYLSDDGILGSGDTLLDAGNRGPLTAGAFSDVPFSGTWPVASGAKRLFVLISAVDDLVTANNRSAGSAITLNLPNYSGTVAHSSGTTAGAAFTGSLTIDNIGLADGSQDISWSVYASLGDAVIDAGDKLVDTGTIAGGLDVAEAPAVVPIGSTWPPAAGSYFLVALISAADEKDTSGNQSSANVLVGSVDYAGSVSFGSGDTANRPFTGSLTIINSGNRDGAADVNYTVYASLGNTTIDATDKVVGTGTIGSLPAGVSSGPLPIINTWPSASGSYCLVAEVQAADDYLPGNNRFSDAVDVYSPSIDYTALNVAYDPTPPSTTMPGGTVLGTFQYRNAGADGGIQTVFWTAYASLNATLDASDTWIASGIAGPLAAMTTSPLPISFSGHWPLDYGNYHLLVMVSEIEDINPANDRVASAATTTVGMYMGVLAEAPTPPPDPNGDYTTFVRVFDTGVTMEPGTSIYLDGTMPQTDLDDVVGVKAGACASITATMTLTGGSGDIALYIFTYPPRVQVKAVSISGAPSLSLSWPAVPGTQYWIDVTNYSLPLKDLGPYTLVITAN